MKAKDIRELSIDELKQKDKDLKEKIFNLKIQLSTNQLANTAELAQVKKDSARVKTILREKQIQAK